MIDSSRRSLELVFTQACPTPPYTQTPPPQAYNVDYDEDSMSPSKAFALLGGYDTDTETDPIDELDEYFRMKREKNRKDGEPVQWWAARRAQFPRLAQFARDIHCIPGMSIYYFSLYNVIRSLLIF